MNSTRDILQAFASLSTEEQHQVLALTARFVRDLEQRAGLTAVGAGRAARRTMPRRPPTDTTPGHRRHGVHR